MSKSTISERAVEYMADAMDKREETTDQEQNQTLRHLVQFAAREVARARREAIDACDVVLAGVRNGGARNAVKAVRARIIHASLPLLDNVLRERGLTHVGFIEKGGVVTDVNHKPVKQRGEDILRTIDPAPKFDATKRPGAALSALARATKKGAR